MNFFNKGISLIVIILIIAGIFVLVGGGYYLYQELKTENTSIRNSEVSSEVDRLGNRYFSQGWGSMRFPEGWRYWQSASNQRIVGYLYPLNKDFSVEDASSTLIFIMPSQVREKSKEFDGSLDLEIKLLKNILLIDKNTVFVEEKRIQINGQEASILYVRDNAFGLKPLIVGYLTIINGNKVYGASVTVPERRWSELKRIIESSFSTFQID